MSAAMSARERKQFGWLILVGVPLFGVVGDFAALLVTYRVLASNAPAVLGEVAASPGTWALWIALMKLPFTLTESLLLVRPRVRRFWATGEMPAAPERKGLRGVVITLRREGVDAAMTAVAALVVVGYLARVPVNDQAMRLIALSAAGTYLLPTAVGWLVKLLAWLWRRFKTARKSQPNPVSPGEQLGHPPHAEE
jgi:hypothetical protein